MKAIQVIIVDDEPIARDIMESYLQKIPGAEIVAICKNALEAFRVISSQPVDLMLLDINMPEISGMDFLRTLKDPPYVILTTAYPEFAIESYELNVVDYLLKPVPFERFLKAINKATGLIRAEVPADSAFVASSAQDEILFVKSGSKLVKIDLSEIWYAEGLKDYVRIWSEKGTITVHTTMKNLEEQLPVHKNFLRIHKSYLINLKYVSEVNGNLIKVQDQQLAIGNTYKEEVNRMLDRFKLL